MKENTLYVNIGKVSMMKNKDDWMEKAREKQAYAREKIDSIGREFRENPEIIAEYLKFGTNFHQYSERNIMLIYGQNRGATYVQSFKGWKDQGYSVKKGEKGLSVFVPVQSTLLKIAENQYIQLRDATDDQKKLMREGKIETKTQLHFKIGNVFDISQTTFPKERYPELFHMGYQSEEHALISQGLKEYAEERLNYSVRTVNFNSISLRGTHSSELKSIKMSHLLEDTMYLSTLSHEIGHAIANHNPGSQKSVAQKEYEGDCFSILLYEKLGLEITDTRKRHFATHFRSFENEIKEKYKDLPEDEVDKIINEEMESSFSFVFSKYGQEIDSLESYINKHTKDLQKNEKNLMLNRRTAIQIQPKEIPQKELEL